MAYQNSTRRLELSFSDSEFDWINFTIRLGRKSLTTRFSAVYDPLPRFRRWLESLVLQDQPSSRFEWDAEGPTPFFDFERSRFDEGRFTAGTDGKTVELSGVVDCRQVVSTLYRGFRSLRSSAKFVPMRYERQELWETLTSAIRMDFPELVEHLTRFDPESLTAIFASGRPSFKFSHRYSINSHWQLEVYSDASYRESRTVPRDEALCVRWTLPPDFKRWNKLSRYDLVEQCLSQPTAIGVDGSKITELYSEVIEGYLRESAPANGGDKITNGWCKRSASSVTPANLAAQRD